MDIEKTLPPEIIESREGMMRFAHRRDRQKSEIIRKLKDSMAGIKINAPRSDYYCR